MDDLVTWVRARLDKDERVARACDGDGEVEWVGDDAIEHGGKTFGRHIRRHIPSRVLRQVEALRAILDSHEVLNDTGRPGAEYCRACYFDRGYGPMPCATVRAVASIWSDRPDYPLRPTPEPAAVEVTGTWASSAVISPTWLS